MHENNVPVGRVALACAVFLLNLFLTIDSVALLHRYRHVVCPNRGRSYSVTLVQTLTGLLILGVPFQEIMGGGHCEWQVLGTWFGVQLLASPLVVQVYRIYNLVLIETDKVEMHQVSQDRRKLTTFMKRSARSAEGFTQVCLAVILAVPSIIFVADLAQNNGNISCPDLSAQGTFTAPLVLCALSILVAILGCAILWKRYSTARGAVSELVPQLLMVALCVILAYSIQAGTKSPLALYFLNIMVMLWQMCYIFIPVHFNQRRVMRELNLAAEISVVHSHLGLGTSTTALHQRPSRVIVRTAVPVHTMTEGEFSRALLESPETLATVLEHLRRKFCVENLIFLQQAWSYEEEPTVEMMDHLYEWFIRVGSPLELSILNAEKTRVRQGVEKFRSQLAAHIAATNAYMAAMAPPAPTIDPAVLKSIAPEPSKLEPVSVQSDDPHVQDRDRTQTHSDHTHPDEHANASDASHNAVSSKDDISNEQRHSSEQPAEPGSRRLSPDDGSVLPEVSAVNEDNSALRLSPDVSGNSRQLVDINNPRSSNSSFTGTLLYSMRPSSISNSNSNSTGSGGITYPSSSTNNSNSNNNSPERGQLTRGVDGANLTLIAIAEDLEGPKSDDSQSGQQKALEIQVKAPETRRATALDSPRANLESKTSAELDIKIDVVKPVVNVIPSEMIGFAPPPSAAPTPPPELFRVSAFLVLRLVKASLPKSLTLQVMQRVDTYSPNPLHRRIRRGFMSRDGGTPGASPGASPGNSPPMSRRESQRARRQQLSAIPVGLGTGRGPNDSNSNTPKFGKEKDSGSNPNSARASRQISVAHNLEDRFSARLSQLGLHRKNQLSLKGNPIEIQAELQNELKAHVQETMLAQASDAAQDQKDPEVENNQQNPMAALSVAQSVAVMEQESASVAAAIPATKILAPHRGGTPVAIAAPVTPISTPHRGGTPVAIAAPVTPISTPHRRGVAAAAPAAAPAAAIPFSHRGRLESAIDFPPPPPRSERVFTFRSSPSVSVNDSAPSCSDEHSGKVLIDVYPANPFPILPHPRTFSADEFDL